MRHVLSALVQNQPGVLAHISGMLASRGFNIDSLAVGETEDANLSRMTFVVHGDDAELEQVRKQLHKVVTVVKVQDISSEDFVERDLMLIKVKAAPSPAPPRRRRMPARRGGSAAGLPARRVVSAHQRADRTHPPAVFLMFLREFPYFS